MSSESLYSTVNRRRFGLSVTSGSGTAPAAARPPADAAANFGEAPPLRSVSLRETELPSDSSPKFASPETILSLSLSGSFILQATFSPSLESNFCQARCLIIIGTEGIGYIAPLDFMDGKATQIWSERDRKLEQARKLRRERGANKVPA